MSQRAGRPDSKESPGGNHLSRTRILWSWYSSYRSLIRVRSARTWKSVFQIWPQSQDNNFHSWFYFITGQRFKWTKEKPFASLETGWQFQPLLELHVPCAATGLPKGNGKKLSSSQAQLGQETCLAVALFLTFFCGPSCGRTRYKYHPNALFATLPLTPEFGGCTWVYAIASLAEDPKSARVMPQIFFFNAFLWFQSEHCVSLYRGTDQRESDLFQEH